MTTARAYDGARTLAAPRGLRLAPPARPSFAAALGLAFALCSARARAETETSSPRTEWTAGYTGEAWRNTRGGVEVGGGYLEHAEIALDHGRDWRGRAVQARLHAIWDDGTFNERRVGSAHGISNVEAPQALRVLEAWVDLALAPHASLRVGLMDLDAEFDALETGGLFLNPSHGIGLEIAQSGANGPSIFPVTSAGARIAGAQGGWSWRLVALDGVPGDPERPRRTAVRFDAGDGALLAAEVDRDVGGARIGVGHWRYTARFAPLDDDAMRARGNHGAYGFVDTALGNVGDYVLRGFVRSGVAARRFNTFDRYAGTGLSATGSWRDRELAVGLAVAYARAGRVARALDPPRSKHETVVELTTRIAVLPWLAIQPDLQYVVNPGLDSAARDALAIGVRFEFLAGGSLRP